MVNLDANLGEGLVQLIFIRVEVSNLDDGLESTLLCFNFVMVDVNNLDVN